MSTKCHTKNITNYINGQNKRGCQSWRRQEANEPMKKRKVGLSENRMFEIILLAYLCKIYIYICLCANQKNP